MSTALHRLAGACCGLCLLVLTAAPAAAQDKSYKAVVKADDTPVHSGAGRMFYRVGELDKGAVVQVEEVIFGWAKVRAPKGVYSYVSKGMLDKKGDGTVGVINRDRTPVRAADVAGPGNSYREQMVLNRGDEVRIAGEDGGYYQVVPPAGAYVFLPPDTVRKANQNELVADDGGSDTTETTDTTDTPDTPDTTDTTDVADAGDTADGGADAVADAGDATNTTDATADATDTTDTGDATDTGEEGTAMADAGDTTDAAGAADAGDTTDATDTATDTLDTADAGDSGTPEIGIDVADAGTGDAADGGTALDYSMLAGNAVELAESDVLKALETEQKANWTTPLRGQPLEEMEQAYLAVQDDAALTPMDKQIVELRLATIERNRKYQQAVKRIRAAKEARAAPMVATDAADDEEGPRDYSAVGILRASSVYDGTNLPRMFRLVDPTTDRTIAYLSPDDVDAGAAIGKMVGVIGEQGFDPATSLRMFEVERIDVLTASPE